MFRRNKHMRCNWTENPLPPFPVREIAARDLCRGMTIAGFPPGWYDIIICCGHWPVVIDDPQYREHGEGDEPCVYWTTDEPGHDNGDRSPHYWAIADLPITVAA